MYFRIDAQIKVSDTVHYTKRKKYIISVHPKILSQFFKVNWFQRTGKFWFQIDKFKDCDIGNGICKRKWSPKLNFFKYYKGVLSFSSVEGMLNLFSLLKFDIPKELIGKVRRTWGVRWKCVETAKTRLLCFSAVQVEIVGQKVDLSQKVELSNSWNIPTSD